MGWKWGIVNQRQSQRQPCAVRDGQNTAASGGRGRLRAFLVAEARESVVGGDASRSPSASAGGEHGPQRVPQSRPAEDVLVRLPYSLLDILGREASTVLSRKARMPAGNQRAETRVAHPACLPDPRLLRLPKIVLTTPTQGLKQKFGSLTNLLFRPRQTPLVHDPSPGRTLTWDWDSQGARRLV